MIFDNAVQECLGCGDGIATIWRNHGHQVRVGLQNLVDELDDSLTPPNDDGHPDIGHLHVRHEPLQHTSPRSEIVFAPGLTPVLPEPGRGRFGHIDHVERSTTAAREVGAPPQPDRRIVPALNDDSELVGHRNLQLEPHRADRPPSILLDDDRFVGSAVFAGRVPESGGQDLAARGLP